MGYATSSLRFSFNLTISKWFISGNNTVEAFLFVVWCVYYLFIWHICYALDGAWIRYLYIIKINISLIISLPNMRDVDVWWLVSVHVLAHKCALQFLKQISCWNFGGWVPSFFGCVFSFLRLWSFGYAFVLFISRQIMEHKQPYFIVEIICNSKPYWNNHNK